MTYPNVERISVQQTFLPNEWGRQPHKTYWCLLQILQLKSSRYHLAQSCQQLFWCTRKMGQKDHMEHTFDSFIFQFSSLECWTPLVIVRQMYPTCRRMWCKATTFYDTTEYNTAEPASLFFSEPGKKRYDLGDITTDYGLIELIDEARRNACTILLSSCFFSKFKPLLMYSSIS